MNALASFVLQRAASPATAAIRVEYTPYQVVRATDTVVVSQ